MFHTEPEKMVKIIAVPSSCFKDFVGCEAKARGTVGLADSSYQLFDLSSPLAGRSLFLQAKHVQVI